MFDVMSKDFEGHDMTQFENCLDALTELSPNVKIFCLIHKMDLLPEADRDSTFESRKADIVSKINNRF